MSALTPQQQAAIHAHGNVLVAAGAGTGKTSTIVERCLQLVIDEGCPLENILMVTFTEAAAAEMRGRIRQELRKRIDAEERGSPDPQHVRSREDSAGRETRAPAGRLTQELALLDAAPISTLHSFCLDLVRRHFHQLGLDPEISVLDEQQTAPLMHRVLDELFQRHYSAVEEAKTRNEHSPGNPPPRADAYGLRELVRSYGRGNDEPIRKLVVQIHRHTQALASPERWLTEQIASFSEDSPLKRRQSFAAGVADWAAAWREGLPTFTGNSKNVAACKAALASLPSQPSFDGAAKAVAAVVAADNAKWAYGTKGEFREPLKEFFRDAAFLHELARNGGEGLSQDWAWVSEPMLALLELAREFTGDFTRAKRELGGVDFADQEQLALRLLYNDDGRLSPVARACRERFRFVFVDECQDINAAQDAILRAVSREGAEANRFLVGDVKQSIYRFRLADPRIFQSCEEKWKQPGAAGQFLPLSDNFRSREALLRFINPLFRALMRRSIGGVDYDADAELQFGKREERLRLSLDARASSLAASREQEGRVTPCAPVEATGSIDGAHEEACPTDDSTEADRWPRPDEIAPRAELHLIGSESDLRMDGAGEDEEAPTAELLDLPTTEREARLIALRLKELKDSRHRIWDKKRECFRRVEYSDMVVLMRGIAARAEAFAKEFHRAGVPLHAERAGFLDALEVTDLVNLLRLLDNPLQDLPLLAVLRSPLVGLSADELVEVRLAHRNGSMWTALARCHETHRSIAGGEVLIAKIDSFLQQFTRWRALVRHSSLSHCLETALTETHYEAMLLAGERGPERLANVRRLADLTRRFDPYQREGLFRFLRFIDEQEEADVRHEPSALQTGNAVRLMTIHQSKGQEFPVVVVAGLGNAFNLRDLFGDILLQEDAGLCPKVVPPGGRRRYPSFAHWLAVQRERRALLGEEMRLLYVALTRAQDTLILTGTASKKTSEPWDTAEPITDFSLLKARCYLDWLRLWLPHGTAKTDWRNDAEGSNDLLGWRIHDPLDRVFARTNTRGKPSEVIEAPAIPTQAEFARLKQRLAWRYPFPAATVEPAKTSVSVLRWRAMAQDDEEARRFFLTPFGRSPVKRGAQSGLSAAERGNAHHLFLQSLNLEPAGSETGLRAEAERLQKSGLLSSEHLGALDFEALAAFWESEVGQQFRQEARSKLDSVERELAFTARFSPTELAGILGGAGEHDLENEFVVVQGVADLVALLPQEIWLLDFKTDEVTEKTLAEKVRHYEPQLKLYAKALGQIYQRPVRRCWLHFLALSKTVPI